MSTNPQVSDAQQALFRKWAEGTDFALDTYDRPKRQFNVLAQLLGWKGGEEPWNANWKACFDEEYIWRGDGATLSDDLKESAAFLQSIWSQYDGFTPDPEADFIDEFKRLADHLGWDEDEKKRNRPKFIEAEFGSYYGYNSNSLRNWHKLCRVCLVDPLPKSIQRCTEALQDVLVNIINLVNNRRTGERIIIFPTKRHFIDYTYPDRTYPLTEAKSNPLMNSLLRPDSKPMWWKKADEEFDEYMEGRLMGAEDMSFRR